MLAGVVFLNSPFVCTTCTGTFLYLWCCVQTDFQFLKGPPFLPSSMYVFFFDVNRGPKATATPHYSNTTVLTGQPNTLA